MGNFWLIMGSVSTCVGVVALVAGVRRAPRQAGGTTEAASLCESDAGSDLDAGSGSVASSGPVKCACSVSRVKLFVLAAVAFVIAVASFMAWNKATQVEKCCELLGDMGAAVELYIQDNDDLPKKLELLVPVYLDELPACPLHTDGDNWAYEVAPEMFTISCKGHRHAGWGGTSEGYPKYSSEQGILRGSVF